MSTSTIPWRKRSIDSDSPIENKRPRNTCWYFRLASESPTGTEDDTESIYSIQDKETDVVKDTSDTDTNSEYEVDVEIEYDIASLSGSDRDNIIFGSSSDSEDMVLAAAVVCDSSLETFVTDAEDSDNSQDDSSTGLMDFWTCIQCKSQNDNPQFRYCDKCFQDRKTFFPPRPRRHRKAKRTVEKSHSPVKLDALQSCLSGLSQDSGIGSSQEFPSLCLDQIVVPPQHLKPEEKPSTSLPADDGRGRKRQVSESSLSEDCEVARPKKLRAKRENKENGVAAKEEGGGATAKEEGGGAAAKEDKSEVKGPLQEMKEPCIMCNSKPKNSVFLHGRIAHMCCCYACAMRTWKTLKRCPICKRTVSNVVRVFTT